MFQGKRLCVLCSECFVIPLVLFLVCVFSGCTSDQGNVDSSSGGGSLTYDSGLVATHGKEKFQESPSVHGETFHQSELVNVMVSSQPSGARIFIDGRDTGSLTDCMVWNVPSGTRVFEYRLDGYKGVTVKEVLHSENLVELATVILEADSSGTGSGLQNIPEPLPESYSASYGSDSPGTSKPSSGKKGMLIVVTEPSGARVSIDEMSPLTSPVEVSLVPGDYTVKISSPGFVDLIVTKSVIGGKDVKLSLRLRPVETVESLVRLGRSFLSLGNTVRGSECFYGAVELEPENETLHLMLIDSLFRGGKYPEALRAAERAFVLIPQSLSISYFLGLALYHNDRFRQALPYLEAAASKENAPTERLESLAVCYESLQLWPEVKKTADRLCAVEPSGERYNLRGFALYKMEKYADSCQAFERALEFSPDSYEILLNGAGAYMAAGNQKKGKQLLKRALKVNPDSEIAGKLLQ